MDYGREIAGTRPPDLFPRLKNRLMTRLQDSILKTFRRLEKAHHGGRLFSAAARKLIGAHLYSLKLELNTRCTLKCKMCYVKHDDSAIPMGLLDKVFRDLRGCGVRIELLGGEPLLRDDIHSIVRAARETALSPVVTLYTNAVHADPVTSRSLAEAGLHGALVTMVSHREEVHDSFCGVEGTWRRTLEGMGHLMDAGVKVYAFTAVHRENAGDVREISRFVREELGAHSVFYQYIPQLADDPLALGRREWAGIRDWIVDNTDGSHMDFVGDFYKLTGSACSGGNFVLTVRSDGSVQPCPFVYDIPLGSIHTDDIWTIYRNRYRGTRLREFKRLPEECSACTYRSVCTGGCRASCGMLSGTYLSRDQRCQGPYSEPFDGNSVLKKVPTFF
ncbi:MAG: radical SAM protein [Candidatus Fermentibacteraceae bacterium]|nr:radical SAM protein [Candidatus Fermentibacteraceae bacterium]MBN2607736.1 radical SAM protein [Candidatus Fermentibacteraceae bacterium]